MGEASQTMMAKVVGLIINPLILLIFSAGVFMFMWGLVVFMVNPTDTTRRKEGVQHMLWGVVGVFIMATVYGIINVIAETFGIPMP